MARVYGGESLAAPSRGMRPSNSRLQTKGEHGRRTARQQPYRTQTTSEVTATVTVILRWASSVTKALLHQLKPAPEVLSHYLWRLVDADKTTMFRSKSVIIREGRLP